MDNSSKMLVEWKKFAIMTLVKSLKPTESVLQIGFVSAEISNFIQDFKPKSHTIIESNSQLSEEIKAWSAAHTNSTVITETWEHALPKLGNFDFILFSDDSETSTQDTLHQFDKDEMVHIADKSNKMIEQLAEKMAQVKVKFTDEQVEDFYQNVGKSYLKELPKFFENLVKNGNLTEEQHKKIIKKYLSGIPSTNEDSQQTQTIKDPLLNCLDKCLKDHMQKGSRFVSFTAKAVSKYEDAQFFEKIITNSSCNYQEEVVTLTVHSKHVETLLIHIQKLT